MLCPYMSSEGVFESDEHPELELKDGTAGQWSSKHHYPAHQWRQQSTPPVSDSLCIKDQAEEKVFFYHMPAWDEILGQICCENYAFSFLLETLLHCGRVYIIFFLNVLAHLEYCDMHWENITVEQTPCKKKRMPMRVGKMKEQFNGVCW